MPHAVDRIFWLIRSAIIPVGLAMLAAAVLTTSSQAQEWPTTDWQPVCYEYRASDCDLQDEGIAVSLEQLREASRYFSALGFRPPAIDRRYANSDILGTYPAFFEQQPWDDGNTWGAYHPETELLRLSYEDYWVFDREGVWFMYTPTHELFHAIQFAYPALAAIWDTGKEGEWIIEGTAVAAEAVRAGDVDAIPRTAALDSPLYDMRTLSGVESRYLSYPFWLYLADRYGGGLPDGIAILHDIFSAADNYGTRRRAIDMIDGALRRYDPEGLYDIYPSFIAEYGAEQNRYSDVDTYDVLPPENAHPGLYNLQIDGTVAPLAAKPYHIRAIGVPAGEDHEASEVEIRLETENPEALHLIVDDTRFDAITRSSGGERNVYTAKFRGDLATDVFPVDEYFVRVVNVSRDPAAYRDHNFKLIVTVYHEYAFMQSNGKAGSQSGLAEQISSASMEKLDRMSGYLSPHGGHQTTLEMGLSNPCVLRLQLFDEGRNPDAVYFQMNHDGPIAPGSYPIVSEPRGIRPENYPNQVLAGFTLGELHPLAQGYPQIYDATGGVLTLTTVTSNWIAGSGRILGTLRSKGYVSGGPPPDGPNPHAIEIDFSIRNQWSAMDSDACVVSRP